MAVQINRKSSQYKINTWDHWLCEGWSESRIFYLHKERLKEGREREGGGWGKEKQEEGEKKRKKGRELKLGSGHMGIYYIIFWILKIYHNLEWKIEDSIKQEIYRLA